jgi:hypothetical protein
LLLVQSKALDEAPYKLSGAVVKLAGITFWSLASSYWFDKPQFLTEGRLATVLIIPSSWGSQLGGYLPASVGSEKCSFSCKLPSRYYLPSICWRFVLFFFTHKACHLSFSPNLKYILLCRMNATFFSGFLSASTCLRLLYLSFIHTPSVLYYSAYEIWSKSQINMFDQVYIWQNTHIYDIHNMKLYFVALLTILFYIIDVNMFSYIISQIFNIWFWPILYAQ